MKYKKLKSAAIIILAIVFALAGEKIADRRLYKVYAVVDMERRRKDDR